MFLPMIDTLVAMIDIHEYEFNSKGLLQELENKKSRAKDHMKENISKVETVKLGDMVFEVLPNGKKGYAYILHNDFYELNLAQYRSKNKDFYPVLIRLKSEVLWCLGPKKAWGKIYDCIYKNTGCITANKISRIDLCCHTDEMQLDIYDVEKFKGQYYTDNIYRYRRRLTGINFGSSATGKIYCRIYDKYLETQQRKKKKWFFNIWKSKGMNPEKVWNIEFQICREYLKEYKIETIEDAFQRLGSLWDYCTKTWLVKVELDNSKVERRSINEKWKKLQEVFARFRHEPLIKRKEQVEAELEALIPSTMGNITTFCARASVFDEDIGYKILKMYGNKYFQSKKIKFMDVVKEKSELVSKVPEGIKGRKVDVDISQIFTESEVKQCKR